MRIAFDIDDTLLIPSVAMLEDKTFGERYERTSAYDTPNYDTIAILKWFQAQGNEIVLWSGSGVDWAKTWGEKFGLMPFTVQIKQKDETVDIAFDDCDVDLAKVNVKVKRLNNSISRADWNKNKKI